ncbi:MAG: type II toxin-antitoxin system VapC family toxin [Bacteroidales bacterium]|jgi:predicted nucleic acid-binding protein
MSGKSIVSDTNPLIYLLQGNSMAEEYLDGRQVWISVISELELFGKKGLKPAELLVIQDLVDHCFIMDLNPGIKKYTKELLQNSNLKLPDAIVAATAMYLDLPLLTADTQFRQINGLKLILSEF